MKIFAFSIAISNVLKFKYLVKINVGGFMFNEVTVTHTRRSIFVYASIRDEQIKNEEYKFDYDIKNVSATRSDGILRIYFKQDPDLLKTVQIHEI